MIPPVSTPHLPPPAALPPGWKQTPAKSLGQPRQGAAVSYVRQDGGQVFFDRRARSGDPLEAIRPGWDWLARRADGQVLGHPATTPDGSGRSGLFLPRKFKSALEAMRVLDLEVPLPTTPATASSAAAAEAKVRKRIPLDGADRGGGAEPQKL